MRGPVAPKDPTKQRAKIYFMLEDLLYASHKEPDGDRYAEMIFLENRVGQNLQLICPDLSSELANRLQKTADFREIVHSIGVIAERADGGDAELGCATAESGADVSGPHWCDRGSDYSRPGGQRPGDGI